jgi:hypothetical protein
MTTIRRIMVLAVALAGVTLVQAAEAQSTRVETRSEASQSYPRTYGSGDNIMVDYGPMGQGALVGGGRVSVSQPSGMNVEIMHLDAQFAQQPRQGFVPLTIGSGESQETVWVPAAMVDMVRRARGTSR